MPIGKKRPKEGISKNASPLEPRLKSNITLDSFYMERILTRLNQEAYVLSTYQG